MDFDQFSLTDKIVKDLNHILLRIESLESFELIPVDTNAQNKSPLLRHDHSVGLESWCVKHVYMTCYNELMDSLQKGRKRKIDPERRLHLLNVILLLNPDLMTMWNSRRELVLKGILDAERELHYVRLVLSRKPKCSEAYSYRIWIYKRLLKDNTFVQGNNFPAMSRAELQLCSQTSRQSPNNYHSWSYRIWFMKQLESNPGVHSDLKLNLRCTEYANSEQLMITNVSDHSCFQYRQFCVQNIFKLKGDDWREFDKYTSTNLRRNLIKLSRENHLNVPIKEEDNDETVINYLLGNRVVKCECKPSAFLTCRKIEILLYELCLNEELIQFYKNHEALWYHRRFVVHEIVSMMYEYHGVVKKNAKIIKSCEICTSGAENKAKIARYDSECISKTVLYKVLTNFDNKFINNRRINNDNYADRHEKYMKFIEGVTY